MLIFFIVVTGLHLAVMVLLSVAHLRHRRPPPADRQLPLSVIIAARNEEENLGRNLPYVLEQAYDGPFEVIVVLDRCTDASAEVVAGLQAAYANLRAVVVDEVPEGWAPKKWALHQGIAAAKHDHFAFTDADCRPEKAWLEGLNRHFAAGKELVLGFGPYARYPGPLNLLIQFETGFTAFLYLSLTFLRFPYMAVGRNLGYTRAFFERAGGFDAIAGRLSGDDDLLVNQHAVPGKTGLMTGSDTLSWSEPERNFRDWMAQKIRHLSAGTGYTTISQLILSGIHGLHAIFYLSLIGVLFFAGSPEWAGIVYVLRTLVLAACLSTGKLFQTDWRWLPFFPLLDVGYLLYQSFLVPASLIFEPKWRGK
ncbi:MAG: glycosyltransferase [Bacteroidota bacterium]